MAVSTKVGKPKAGFGLVVANDPYEGAAYVLPMMDTEILFGKAKDLVKIIEAGEGDGFDSLLARCEKMLVLRHGSKGFKDGFYYEPGDAVIYLELIKVKSYFGEASTETVEEDTITYVVLGSFFDKDTTDRKPIMLRDGERRFEFPDGTSFAYDRDKNVFGIDFKDKCYLRYYADEGELLIKVSGDIKIEGSEIHLN